MSGSPILERHLGVPLDSNTALPSPAIPMSSITETTNRSSFELPPSDDANAAVATVSRLHADPDAKELNDRDRVAEPPTQSDWERMCNYLDKLDTEIKRIFSKIRQVGGGRELSEIILILQQDIRNLKDEQNDEDRRSALIVSFIRNDRDFLSRVNDILDHLGYTRIEAVDLDDDTEDRQTPTILELFDRNRCCDRISELRRFRDETLPVLLSQQQEEKDSMTRLLTVSTFFSAVTITGIQFSYPLNDTRVQVGVNACWFLSLIFSLNASVSCIFIIAWASSFYRPFKRSTPTNWVLFQRAESAPNFIACAFMLFTVGLVLFSWGSNQHRHVSIAVTVFSTLFTLSLYLPASLLFIVWQLQSGVFPIPRDGLGPNWKSVFRATDSLIWFLYSGALITAAGAYIVNALHGDRRDRSYGSRRRPTA